MAALDALDPPPAARTGRGELSIETSTAGTSIPGQVPERPKEHASLPRPGGPLACPRGRLGTTAAAAGRVHGAGGLRGAQRRGSGAAGTLAAPPRPTVRDAGELERPHSGSMP